ncbi:TraR/DksA family transcriptional regulator [Microbacterium testaceum]
MAAGTYGVCLRCGLLLDEGRLDVLPQAECCIDCAR